MARGAEKTGQRRLNRVRLRGLRRESDPNRRGWACAAMAWTLLLCASAAAEEFTGAVDLKPPFTSDKGFAWRAPSGVDWPSDGTAGNRISKLVLLEDGEALGPAHAQHVHIREGGRGRFSHWKGRLVFSTSDNSDPNRNGRRYRIAKRSSRAGVARPPKRSRVTLERPFVKTSGNAFLAWVPPAWPWGDKSQGHTSKLVLEEDGKALGPLVDSRFDVRSAGGGRYAHQRGELLFTSSDGTDPNTNGRTYVARVAVPKGVGQFGYEGSTLADPFELLEQVARTQNADPAVSRQTLAAGAPRVVYWYTIDALRADVPGARLAGKPVTPALDAFAGDAVTFENAYAHGSNTKVSTASMFTGLFPARHGAMPGFQPVWPKGGRLLFDLDFRFTTLAEYLASLGFETWSHLYTIFVTPTSGLLQGFQQLALALQKPEAVAPLPERLFVYEHRLGLHAPYRPSPEAIERFGLTPAKHVDPAATDWYWDKLPAKAVEELRRAYLAEGWDADRLFAARMDWLRTSGLYDEALIIVTADHGEEFMEHGRLTHTTQLYEEVVHVPLFVKFPASSPYAARHGERVPNRVGLVDLYPTIAELVPGGKIPYDLDGRSLLTILDGRETDPYARDVAIRVAAQQARGKGQGPLVIADAMLSGKWKALFGYRIDRSGDGSAFGWIGEMYDLESDPAETRNVARDREQDFYRLLDRHRLTLRPLHSPAVAAAARGAGSPSSSDDEFEGDLLERLRALGYAE